jgi:hypothetical protein
MGMAQAQPCIMCDHLEMAKTNLLGALMSMMTLGAVHSFETMVSVMCTEHQDSPKTVKAVDDAMHFMRNVMMARPP